ncbi:hypothetical protein L7F22_040633 [Adiantum nelumboides]|nr:hypothetical protein [Adiantum nelumboides]
MEASQQRKNNAGPRLCAPSSRDDAPQAEQQERNLLSGPGRSNLAQLSQQKLVVEFSEMLESKLDHPPFLQVGINFSGGRKQEPIVSCSPAHSSLVQTRMRFLYCSYALECFGPFDSGGLPPMRASSMSNRPALCSGCLMNNMKGIALLQ